ncbi:MAG TPA: hypothetical protein PKM73_15870 [Verrucomicrobiota bacterium]|nr:hypothetical protein [Verrucomicrobiota bacterium]
MKTTPLPSALTPRGDGLKTAAVAVTAGLSMPQILRGAPAANDRIRASARGGHHHGG